MPVPTSEPDYSDPTLRFEAVPYEAEGGYTLPGLFLTFVFSLIGGIAAGVLARWIGQWFYLIILFPFVIGVIVGFCGALAVYWGKLRNTRLAFAAGIAGGCLAMATMHYFEFYSALAEADKIVPGTLELKYSLSAFGHFIDKSAEDGVQLMHRPGQQGTNLGYYGTYLYWVLEIFIVSVIAAAIVAAAAAKPFCSECATWKEDRKLGRVNVPRDVVLQAITSGELLRLAGKTLGPGPGRLSLEIAVCPNCGPSVPVDVLFKEVTVDSKAKEKVTEIAHVTYPGQSLQVFEALFETNSQGQTSTSEPLSTADRAPKRPVTDRERIALIPVKKKHPEETWGLELDEEAAILVDSEDRVMATISRDEAASRLVFPSFWDSIRNLGILTDEGKVVWFKPDKPAIKEIKKHLKA